MGSFSKPDCMGHEDEQFRLLRLLSNRWLLIFFAIITIRNFLEGFLEYPHRLIKATDCFSLSLFYISVFLCIIIVLRLLTRWPISRLFKYVTISFGLIILPPILDWFISKGKGYVLAYPIVSPGQMFRAMPFLLKGLEGISPGMQIEIGLSLLLTGVFLAIIVRLCWWRVIIGVLAVYTIICAHGFYPGLISHVSSLERQVVLGSIRQLQFAPTEPRHALAIPLEGLILALLYRKKDVITLLRQVRISQAIFYGSMAFWGVILAYRIAPHLTRNIRSISFDMFNLIAMPVDEMPVRFGLFAITSFAAYWFAQVVNDFFDIEDDRFNGQSNVFACRDLPNETVWMSALAAIVAGIVGALSMGMLPFSYYMQAVLTSLAYSVPPIRLKRLPFLSGLTLAIFCILMVFYGFTVLSTDSPSSFFPREIFWVLLIAIPLGMQVKDLKDQPGDRMTGIWSLPVLFGQVWGKRLVMLTVFMAFMTPGLLISGKVILISSGLLAPLSVLAILWLHPKYAHKFCIFASVLMALAIVIGAEF